MNDRYFPLFYSRDKVESVTLEINQLKPEAGYLVRYPGNKYLLNLQALTSQGILGPDPGITEYDGINGR